MPLEHGVKGFGQVYPKFLQRDWVSDLVNKVKQTGQRPDAFPSHSGGTRTTKISFGRSAAMTSACKA